jgi:molecular chaperone DnaJ
MNKSEAYKILELSEDASDEDAKKAFRKLAAQLHPDRNKEPDAEEKFKLVNKAYQYIQSGDAKNEDMYPSHNYHNPFQSVMPQRRNTILDQIHLNTVILFKDSVLGSKVDIKYDRKIKCDNCEGRGFFMIHNGCTFCKGTGQITQTQGNMQFTRTCEHCHGSRKTEKCTKCSNTGLLDSQSSVQVSVPGGILNGNTLRLQGMGHFMGANNFMGFIQGDQYSDVFLTVNVVQDPDLKIVDNDVVYNLNISLLEALTGANKNVRTILDNKDIVINPKSKNKDEVIINSLGVNRKGNQRVIINIDYPENIDELVNLLSGNKDELN